MKYRGGYSIKNLRQDLEGGLGWAHSTESVANYLEIIIPTVREAKIKGSFRHTSSQDRTDPKKVVTTSFYTSQGGKLATCHAHGDGTWSIAFAVLGREELQKRQAMTNDTNQLDVNVRVEVKDGVLYHHGELKNKPVACRRHVSLNNDEIHRAWHLDNEGKYATSASTEDASQNLVERDMQQLSVPHESQATNMRSSRNWLDYQRSRDRLDPEQIQLATDLARGDLTKKEERALFQKLKEIPWAMQEQILNHSKTLKSPVK